MIIDFTVENFKSIKDSQTFSMSAANLKDEHPENIFQLEKEPNISLLKASVIYGANASGKSNLILALRAFTSFVLYSTDLKVEQDIPYYEPYKLDANYLTKPTGFEMEFVGNGNIRYKYNVFFDRKEVLREELVFYPNRQAARLFLREKGKNIKFGSQIKGRKKGIESELLPNNLFLSKAANSNHQQLKEVYLFFLKRLKFHMPGDTAISSKNQHTTLQLLEAHGDFKRKLVSFLAAADTGIHSIDLKIKNDNINGRSRSAYFDKIAAPPGKPDLTDLPFIPVVSHKVYDNDKEKGMIYFELDEESNGTIKMYNLAGKVINALESSCSFIMDELDSSLHPFISRYILELFNDPKKNPNNAQLIVTTHDISLLNPGLLRRDQVWFTARNDYGATEIFSLDEFDKNEVRKNVPFDRWYLNGRFGALPLIDKKRFHIGNKK